VLVCLAGSYRSSSSKVVDASGLERRRHGLMAVEGGVGGGRLRAHGPS
jgi:hypothetical protein